MCELFGLSSRLPTTVSFSLQRFAARGGFNGQSVDGWGLVFYDGPDVRVFREPEPARDSEWLAFIERRRVSSGLVLSHIRHATQGGKSLANTQPFVREFAGRMHAFLHNGKLAGLSMNVATSARFRPIGETDSEVAACLLYERMASVWRDGMPSLQSRFDAFAQFAADMRAHGPANFLYADGDALFAHGHRRTQANGQIEPPGLWRLCRSCRIDQDALPSSGVRLSDAPADQKLTLLASTPLTDEHWRPLDEGEVLAIRDGEVVYDTAPRRT